MKKYFLIFTLIFAIAITQVFSQAAKQKLGSPAQAPKTENATQDKKKVEPAATSTTKVDKKSNKKAPKPIKGTISSVSNVAKGKYSINKAEAQSCLTNNDPVVFVTGDGKKAKVYFILESDGSFSGKKLAGYAANKKVGVVGKTKTANGLNIIVEEMIESAD